jgi:hypothetical protein
MQQMSITFKYIRPTKTTYGHTDVYVGDVYVGYIMPNRSQYRTVGDNWTFSPKMSIIAQYPTIKYLSQSNKQKLIDAIKLQFTLTKFQIVEY